MPLARESQSSEQLSRTSFPIPVHSIGEVVRRAHLARCKVVVIAAEARDTIGVHTVDGGGRRLAAADLIALAERATREAFE